MGRHLKSMPAHHSMLNFDSKDGPKSSAAERGGAEAELRDLGGLGREAKGMMWMEGVFMPCSLTLHGQIFFVGGDIPIADFLTWGG